MRSVRALGMRAAHRDTCEQLKASVEQQTLTLSCMTALHHPFNMLPEPRPYLRTEGDLSHLGC